MVAENRFEKSFAASWGRNPHRLIGGWQPNLQVEWNDNTVIGGTGITLMTSDQDWDNATGRAAANYTGPLDWRIVLRRNRFEGGSGIGIGSRQSPHPTPTPTPAQTISSVLIEHNVLEAGACNLTTRP